MRFFELIDELTFRLHTTYDGDVKTVKQADYEAVKQSCGHHLDKILTEETQFLAQLTEDRTEAFKDYITGVDAEGAVIPTGSANFPPAKEFSDEFASRVNEDNSELRDSVLRAEDANDDSTSSFVPEPVSEPTSNIAVEQPFVSDAVKVDENQ